MTELSYVVCPTCFESFAVPTPSLAEVPSEMDYDCEVCCASVVLRFFFDELEEVVAEAMSLED